MPNPILYNEGANWVGVLMVGVQWRGGAGGVPASGPRAEKPAGLPRMSICLFIGGLGLISMYFFKDPKLLLISMIGRRASPGPAC